MLCCVWFFHCQASAEKQNFGQRFNICSLTIVANNGFFLPEMAVDQRVAAQILTVCGTRQWTNFYFLIVKFFIG